MLVNVAEGEECRIAVVEKGQLEELYIERTSLAGHVRQYLQGEGIEY